MRSLARNVLALALVPGPFLATLAPTALRAQAPDGRAPAASALPSVTPTDGWFTTSDGIRIHYLTAGDEGSWVVLVHGYTDSANRMWFRTGIAAALAENHRVVALDNRNHGQSDRPEPNGSGRAEDVIELMDHLGIERAHIHGYSMGGGITGQLLASRPDRFITAGFGGSGIRENDPELRAMAEAMDPTAPAPEGASAAAFDRLRASAAARDEARTAAGNTTPAPSRATLEFTDAAYAVPVLVVNGEYDAPYSKSQRILREFTTVMNVVLPAKDHMTAIMVGGPMPPEYAEAMVGFIGMYDGR